MTLTRKGSPPASLVVRVTVGNRDADLREWCWKNPQRAAKLLRRLLRDELTRSGEISAGTTATSAEAAVRPSPAAVSTPLPESRTAHIAPVREHAAVTRTEAPATAAESIARPVTVVQPEPITENDKPVDLAKEIRQLPEKERRGALRSKLHDILKANESFS